MPRRTLVPACERPISISARNQGSIEIYSRRANDSAFAQANVGHGGTKSNSRTAAIRRNASGWSVENGDKLIEWGLSRYGEGGSALGNNPQRHARYDRAAVAVAG